MTSTTQKSQLRLVVTPPRNCSADLPVSGVNLITDQHDNLLERVRIALRGGVAVLQYRAKDKTYEACLSEGMALKQLCRDNNVLFIINDNLKLAHELDADGVHLGQDDGSPSEARNLLGQGKVIGVSTHNLDEALKAESDGADYLGFGAM